jgi:hypothetical protein
MLVPCFSVSIIFVKRKTKKIYINCDIIHIVRNIINLISTIFYVCDTLSQNVLAYGKLTLQVYSYYWFVVFMKENGFAYNFVANHIRNTSW